MPAVRTKVELKGVKKLRLRLAALSIHERIEARRQLSDTAQAVAAEARARAPRGETGKLKDSITSELIEGGAAAIIAADIWRAHFTEFGTVHADAKPFLFPAFRAHRLQHLHEMALAMDRAHRKAAT